MLSYQVKIGLIPLRRDCTPRPGMFNWEKAEERGRACVRYIESHFADDQVSFVDLHEDISVGVLFSENDVDAVVEHMRHERVDAIFLINANFGNEEVAAMVAKALDVPVLLWGPQDDSFEPDGMRYFDSQCGLFAMSRQLKRFHIPFTYIENCRIEEQQFADGLREFVSAACMVKNFRGMRIGQIGLRPKPFCSVIFNEGELMERFGLHVIPINMAVIIDKYNRILTERDAELTEGAKLLANRYVMDELTPPLLKKIYAFVLLHKDLFAEYNLDVMSSECWTSMQLGVGAMPCTAYSILSDQGYLVSCESDLHGAITLALLSCADLGRHTPFFGEFTVRHPQDKNVELLWHCGPFPYSVKKSDCPARLVNMREWFEVKEGKYTVARFDQDDGRYQLLNGTCESASGPLVQGTYLWARFGNLSKWERKLIEGPYIHHAAEIDGDHTAALREFCKYVPGLEPDAAE
jgi:L-fucose isomerase-like protein